MNDIAIMNDAMRHPSPMRQRFARGRRACAQLAFVVGLLALVVAFSALKFTLYAQGAFAEQTAIPIATDGLIVGVTAIAAGLLLRDRGAS